MMSRNMSNQVGSPQSRSIELSADDTRRLASFATVHTRGAGKLTDREIAHGTLEDMIKWFQRVEPGYRRTLILVKDGLEFRPAEVESLARQFRLSRDERAIVDT